MRSRLRRAPIGRQPRGWRAAAAKRFGDVVTCDHIILRRGDGALDFTDERRTAFSVYDVGTGFVGCYPLPNKSAEQVERALRHFIGPQKAKLLYSDGGRELKSAAHALGIPPDSAHPRVHETNSIIELCGKWRAAC